MSADNTDYLTYGYAGVIATGGVLGFFMKGSVPSLAAGLSCGALLALGAFQMSSDPKNVGITLAVSGALAGVMGFRFAQTKKIMPAGLVAAMSAAEVLRLTYRIKYQYDEKWNPK